MFKHAFFATSLSILSSFCFASSYSSYLGSSPSLTEQIQFRTAMNPKENFEYAVHRNLIKAVESFLQSEKANPNAIDTQSGKPLIRIAYEKGFQKLVEVFLRDPRLDLSTLVDTQRHYYAIHLLVALQDPELLKKHIEKKGDIKIALNLRTLNALIPFQMLDEITGLNKKRLMRSEFWQKDLIGIYEFIYFRRDQWESMRKNTEKLKTLVEQAMGYETAMSFYDFVEQEEQFQLEI